MKLETYFSADEMRQYLIKHGCTLKKVKVLMSWPVYPQDDIETAEIEVEGVFKDNQPFAKPSGQSFKSHEWLENAFEDCLYPKFKEFLLSL